MITIFWLIAIAAFWVLLITSYVAVTRPILSNFLMVGFSLCAFFAAAYQVMTGHGNLFISVFNTGVIAVGMYRLRVNSRRFRRRGGRPEGEE